MFSLIQLATKSTVSLLFIHFRLDLGDNVYQLFHFLMSVSLLTFSSALGPEIQYLRIVASFSVGRISHWSKRMHCSGPELCDPRPAIKLDTCNCIIPEEYYNQYYNTKHTKKNVIDYNLFLDWAIPRCRTSFAVRDLNCSRTHLFMIRNPYSFITSCMTKNTNIYQIKDRS